MPCTLWISICQFCTYTHSLFWESYETRKYTLGTNCRVS